MDRGGDRGDRLRAAAGLRRRRARRSILRRRQGLGDDADPPLDVDRLRRDGAAQRQDRGRRPGDGEDGDRAGRGRPLPQRWQPRPRLRPARHLRDSAAEEAGSLPRHLRGPAALDGPPRGRRRLRPGVDARASPAARRAARSVVRQGPLGAGEDPGRRDRRLGGDPIRRKDPPRRIEREPQRAADGRRAADQRRQARPQLRQRRDRAKPVLGPDLGLEPRGPRGRTDRRRRHRRLGPHRLHRLRRPRQRRRLPPRRQRQAGAELRQRRRDRDRLPPAGGRAARLLVSVRDGDRRSSAGSRSPGTERRKRAPGC